MNKQHFFIETISETVIRVIKKCQGRVTGKNQGSFTYPPPAGEKRPPYPALWSPSLCKSSTQTSCAGTTWPREVYSIAPHLVLPSPQTLSTYERAEQQDHIKLGGSFQTQVSERSKTAEPSRLSTSSSTRIFPQPQIHDQVAEA